jgi:hypothetical protein
MKMYNAWSTAIGNFAHIHPAIDTETVASGKTMCTAGSAVNSFNMETGTWSMKSVHAGKCLSNGAENGGSNPWTPIHMEHLLGAVHGAGKICWPQNQVVQS